MVIIDVVVVRVMDGWMDTVDGWMGEVGRYIVQYMQLLAVLSITKEMLGSTCR